MVGQPFEAMKGTFGIQAMSKGPNIPAFAAAWPSFAVDYGRAIYSWPRCGPNQDTVCTTLPSAVDAPKPRYTWDTKVNENGNTMGQEYQCPGYVPFAYDSVVMQALAFDQGISSGLFELDASTGKIKPESVTSVKMLDAHRLMIKNRKYGGCLAGGVLQYNEYQERVTPYYIRNWTPEGGSAGEIFGLVEDGVEAVDWSYGGDNADGVNSAERLTFGDQVARGVANAPSGVAPPPPVCEKGTVWL